MAINGVGHNYDYLGTTTNYIRGKATVREAYEKLCKKFPEITFNTGSSLMSGNENKVVINLSSECLKKMANDPEFAKKVEFNLTGAVPGQNRMFAQAKADNAVIHGVTTVIDADGNASVTCGGMTRTSGSKQNSTILNAEKKLVKSLQNEKKKKKEEKEKIDPKLEAVYHDLEEQMKGILGTKVCINHKDAKKGKLEIEYYSQDELDRIIDMIRTIQK